MPVRPHREPNHLLRENIGDLVATGRVAHPFHAGHGHVVHDLGGDFDVAVEIDLEASDLAQPLQGVHEAALELPHDQRRQAALGPAVGEAPPDGDVPVQPHDERIFPIAHVDRAGGPDLAVLKTDVVAAIWPSR